MLASLAANDLAIDATATSTSGYGCRSSGVDIVIERGGGNEPADHRACAYENAAPLNGVGLAIEALAGVGEYGDAALERFSVTRSAELGISAGANVSLGLEQGAVATSPIGISFIAAPLRIARLDRVIIRDTPAPVRRE